MNDKEFQKQLRYGQSFKFEENSDNQKSSNSDLSNVSNNKSVMVLSQTSTKISKAQSWHGGQTRICDDNVPIDCAYANSNTLVQNVHCNIDKNSCLDKDMSNLFDPFYKHLNTGVVRNRNVVPSSENRARALQLYNYDAEENMLIKDKKQHLFNRHSPICFPTKHDTHLFTPRLIHSHHENHSGKRKTKRSNKRFSSCERKSFKISSHKDGFNNKSIVTDLNLSTLVNSYDASDSNVNSHNECLVVNKCVNTRCPHALDKNENQRCKPAGREEPITVDRRLSSSISSEVHPSRKKTLNSGTYT